MNVTSRANNSFLPEPRTEVTLLEPIRTPIRKIRFTTRKKGLLKVHMLLFYATLPELYGHERREIAGKWKGP